MWTVVSHPFSYYFVNLLAIPLNLITAFVLVWRITATKTTGQFPLLLLGIAKGVLCVAATYQVCLSFARLLGYDLPEQYRDTWVLKDIGYSVYVAAVAYVAYSAGLIGPNGKASEEAPDYNYEGAALAAQAKSVRTAMEVGQHNDDERFRNRLKPEDGSKEP